MRQMQAARVSFKKGCEDAYDSHFRPGPQNSSSNPPKKAPSSKTSSPDKKSAKNSDFEICEELCFTGKAPASEHSFSDEEDSFMGGCADSDDEAELAGIAAAQKQMEKPEQRNQKPEQRYVVLGGGLALVLMS